MKTPAQVAGVFIVKKSDLATKTMQNNAKSPKKYEKLCKIA